MDTSSGSDTDDGDLEGSGGQQQEDSVLTWYLRTARLALALAVIANRPAGSSGRQAAQDLHVRLSGRQSWRARAEHLQDEVLRLRQELLLLHRVGCKPKSNAATGGSPEILAEDPRASPNTVLHGEGDSGCDTGSNTTSLLQSQDLSEAASIHPSLGRGLPFSDLNSQRKTEKTIILHVRFLRDLLALRKIKEVGHGATVAGDDAIIADSVCSLLSCMVSYCTDQTLLLPISFLPEAAQVVASVLEQRSLWKPDCTLYVKKVDDLLKQFTSLILNNAELNMMQEALADCLIHLGRCSLLKSSLVCHLLSEINHFADELWQACQNPGEVSPEFDVTKYENMFYIFWILEQLVQEELGGAGPEDSSEKRLLQQRLERNFLLLSDEFPLFAFYMCRIGAYLSSADPEDR